VVVVLIHRLQPRLMELYGHGVGNYNGILGQNNTTSRSSPVQIPGTTWSSVSAVTQHSLATKTDGTLWSWGHNNLDN
jgi:alpha-tubulin suppressor-like RCC1 family protein